MALNIRTKLTLTVSLLIAGMLTFGALFTAERFRAALAAEIATSQYTMLVSVAEELDTRLESTHSVLIAAARSFPQTLLADPDRVQAELDRRQDLHSLFDNHLFVFTPDGRMFTESPFAPDRRGKDFSFREYIKNTLSTGKPYISNPYISTQAHRHPVIMMTAPIFDRDGKLLAILAASLDLMRDNFLGKLATRTLGHSGYLYLTTGDRIMVMHPDKARIFKPFPQGGNLAYDAAINGFQGTRETTNTYGRHMYVSFTRVKQKDWVLAANYPVEEALAPVAQFKTRMLLLALLGMAVGAWLIHLLMGRLLQPILALTGHMSELSGKQGAARMLAIVSQDEAGRLTQSFNAMVSALDSQQAALEEKEALYRTVVRFANDFIYWREPDGRMRFVSDNSMQVTGYAPADFYRDPGLLDAIVHPEDRARWLEHDQNQDARADQLPAEFRIIRGDGETRWVSHLCQRVIDEHGRDLGVRGSHSDISQRKQAESRLRLAGAVFDSSREAIIVCDMENRIIAVNPAFSLITGYTEAEVLGQNPRLLQSGRTSMTDYAAMWRSLGQHGYWQGEFHNRRKDGTDYFVLVAISAVRDDQGRTTHYVGIESDISAMKAAEDRIEHLAYHDALTSLPNRLLLQERANLALALAHRRREQLAILFLDLDRFKEVNDSLGHSAGDALLVEASRRLTEICREADTVSRLGGDEFVLLTLSVDEDGARQIAEKVLVAMREPFVVEGHRLGLSTSIGIALYPRDGGDMGELLKNADTALYRAKQDGRNALAFYNREMNVAAFEQLVLESELKRAIENGELVTYYQPKIELGSGRLIGAEALIRWQHPQHGLVPPGRFIPMAESSGLTWDIGRWVLGDVCRQLAEWQRQGLPPLCVAVNLTPRDFRNPQLPALLHSLLVSHDLPASALELELTESTLLDAGKSVLNNLLAIQHLGIGLTIDDFGTGYSSLSYLRRLPISVLKIDQSFVHDLELDADDRTLAGSIIALGASLSLGVVAEGIETLAQRDILFELGCKIGQGFLFSRPVPAEEFQTWLNSP